MSNTSTQKKKKWAGNVLADRIGTHGQILYKRKARQEPLPITAHMCMNRTQALALTLIWKRSDYLSNKDYEWITTIDGEKYVMISGENLGTALGKTGSQASRVMRELEALGFIHSVQIDKYQPKVYRCLLNLEDASILYMDLKPQTLTDEEMEIDLMDLDGIDYDKSYINDDELNTFYDALEIEGCKVQYSTTNRVLPINNMIDIAEYDTENVYLMNGVDVKKNGRASNKDIVKKNMFYVDIDMRKDILYGSIPKISRCLSKEFDGLLTEPDKVIKAIKDVFGISLDMDFIKPYLRKCEPISVDWNRFLVDYYQQKFIGSGNFLSKEQMYQAMEMIIEDMKTHPMFRDRHSIVSTGNGFHVYYIGDPQTFDTDDYSYTVGRYLDAFDDILRKYGLHTDKSCRNIGRLSRAPLSLNQSTRSLFNLEEAPVFIYAQQGNTSSLVNHMNNYRDRFREADKFCEKHNGEYNKISHEGGSDYDAIMSYPIGDLITMHTGMKLSNNGKSFLSPRDGKPCSIFINPDRNIVSSNGGSKYLQSGMESLNSFSYIMFEILGHAEITRESSAETFQRARDNILS